MVVVVVELFDDDSMLVVAEGMKNQQRVHMSYQTEVVAYSCVQLWTKN